MLHRGRAKFVSLGPFHLVLARRLRNSFSHCSFSLFASAFVDGVHCSPLSVSCVAILVASSIALSSGIPRLHSTWCVFSVCSSLESCPGCWSHRVRFISSWLAAPPARFSIFSRALLPGIPALPLATCHSSSPALPGGFPGLSSSPSLSPLSAVPCAFSVCVQPCV